MVKRRLLYYVLHLQRETETINAQNETEGFKSSRFINMWNVYAKKKVKLKIKKLFFFNLTRDFSFKTHAIYDYRIKKWRIITCEFIDTTVY